jgi:hypothetical protein
MMRSRALHVLAAVTLLLLASVPASAANARLERVLLLPSPDRSSVVLELTAAPSQVSTRRISESVFEVDAGPGVDNTPPQLLKAPANVRFIDSVSVRITPTPLGPVVRARITMTVAAQAVVRSAGRRVYVDISKAPPATPGLVPAAQTARAGTPAAAPAAAVTRQTPDDVYQSGVRPVIAKLKEIGPFLTSGAASADGSVTTAVLPSLMTIRSSLAALQPPDPARGSHTMVLAAVDRILRALAPDFSGDRATAVRQSMTTIEVVGGVLVGE